MKDPCRGGRGEILFPYLPAKASATLCRDMSAGPFSTTHMYAGELELCLSIHLLRPHWQLSPHSSSHLRWLPSRYPE